MPRNVKATVSCRSDAGTSPVKVVVPKPADGVVSVPPGPITIGPPPSGIRPPGPVAANDAALIVTVSGSCNDALVRTYPTDVSSTSHARPAFAQPRPGTHGWSVAGRSLSWTAASRSFVVSAATAAPYSRSPVVVELDCSYSPRRSG